MCYPPYGTRSRWQEQPCTPVSVRVVVSTDEKSVRLRATPSNEGQGKKSGKFVLQERTKEGQKEKEKRERGRKS